MPKKLIGNLELYEKLHFHELETREHVSSRLQVSLGLVTALASALAFLVGAIDRSGSGYAFVAFWFLLVLDSIALLVAAFRLKAAFWGTIYRELPSGEVVKEFETKVHNHYFDDPLPEEVSSAADTSEASKKLYDEEFKDFLVEKYVNCATHNAQVNMERADHLHEANRAILICAGLAFLAYLVFTFGNLKNHDPAQVKLSSPADVNVLSVPSDCLTCKQRRAETQAIEKGGSASEQQGPAAPATATTSQDSAGPPAGAADQGGRGASAPAASPTKGAVK